MHEETIMGNMPKEPLVGAHVKPRMICFTPTLKKRGRPSMRIKRNMRKRKTSDEKAKMVRVRLTSRSLMAALGDVMSGYQSLFH
jgi:hypothetical protein